MIHRDSPLSVLQTEDFLIFRVGSVLAWFAKGSSEAGIDAGGAGTEALRAFAGYALPGLLLELAGPQGWYGIHAAALCQGQRAVLLPASSGSGKSTIFRQAANAGLGLLSDDLVWMRAGQDGEIRLHAFPRGEPCEPSPDPTIASSKLGWIVTPTIVSDAESRLVPIDFDASLAILLSQTGFLALGAPTGERFRMLVRAARSVGCYRLEAGANRAQTTSILSDLLSCTREAREPLL